MLLISDTSWEHTSSTPCQATHSHLNWFQTSSLFTRKGLWPCWLYDSEHIPSTIIKKSEIPALILKKENWRFLWTVRSGHQCLQMPSCLRRSDKDVCASLCSETFWVEWAFSPPAGETREVFQAFLKRSQIILLLILLRHVGSSFCLPRIRFWPSVGPSDIAETKTRK